MTETKNNVHNEPELGNSTKPLLDLVYLVNRIHTGEYGFTTIQIAFNTKHKAESYKKLLDEKYKDDMSFQHIHFYFEIEELSIS